MGLFGHKQDDRAQPPASDDTTAAQLFFDEYFREELRNRARWYFENIITENAKLFKDDLDATIGQVNTSLKETISSELSAGLNGLQDELKQHATKQLDAQFTEYTGTMQKAQDEALTALTDNAHELTEKYTQLSETVQTKMAEQEAALNSVIEENKARIIAMQTAQDAALEALSRSTEALHEQQKKLSESLDQNVTKQQAMIIDIFEHNMTRIVEQYLLGALGDQFDLKAQLPGIIKQMEENKQAIVDDMKL